MGGCWCSCWFGVMADCTGTGPSLEFSLCILGEMFGSTGTPLRGGKVGRTPSLAPIEGDHAPSSLDSGRLFGDHSCSSLGGALSPGESTFNVVSP